MLTAPEIDREADDGLRLSGAGERLLASEWPRRQVASHFSFEPTPRLGRVRREAEKAGGDVSDSAELIGRVARNRLIG